SCAGAASPHRALRAQGRRLQSCRGWKRRYLLRHRPVHERRRRSAVSSGQRSGEIRARVPRAEIRGSPGLARGRRSTRHAGGERRLPRLDARRRVGTIFLRAPIEEPASRIGRRAGGTASPRQLCASVRAHAGTRPCALGGSGGADGIYGEKRRHGRCAGIFRHGLRGSHPKRLRSAREGEASCSKENVKGRARFGKTREDSMIGPMVVRSALPGAALAACVIFASSVFAETISFKADLKASEAVPPNDSKGTGTVTASYDT